MKAIDPDRPIEVMGILNLTPDSFHAPSRYNMAMLDSGADIIDIGAYSTRPGHTPVSEEEEWHRLEPVLRLIAEQYSHLRISIDTFRGSIVQKAYDIIGPFIVNDVTCGSEDPDLLPTTGCLGLPYIAMHHGPAEDSHEIAAFMDSFAAEAESYGIRHWVADPGFGFGKSLEQNFSILGTLDALVGKGDGLLVGISRKRMAYQPKGITAAEALDATSSLHMEALQKGADIMRVHDVEAAREVIRAYRDYSETR